MIRIETAANIFEILWEKKSLNALGSLTGQDLVTDKENMHPTIDLSDERDTFQYRKSKVIIYLKLWNTLKKKYLGLHNVKIIYNVLKGSGPFRRAWPF